MKKNLLFWPCIGLIVLTIISGFLMERAFQYWFLEHTDEELATATNAVKVMLNKSPHENLIPNLDRISDETNRLKPNVRITLISTDGTVLGDSMLTTSEVFKAENHGNRREVIEALNLGHGKDTRFSTTIQEDLIYYAEFYHDENYEGIIRTSTSLSHLNDALWNLRTIMSFILIGILILIVILVMTSQKLLNQYISESQQALEKNVAERTRDIELLHRLANMLAACNSMKEAQQVVEDIVPRLLGDINGAIALLRSSRNQLEIKLDWGGQWPGEIVYEPDECWALRKGKYHFSKDEHTSLPCQHMANVGADQTLCIPLIAHGNTIGILHLYLGDTAFDKGQLRLAFTIGEHLGLALANLNLQDKLREQAIRDPLTGLYNRRFLEETLEQEIMRSSRRDHCLSILMLDIDHFKRFNDTFGHDAGDFVLKSLSSLLIDNVRGEDIVCRIGGEELAIILPETGAENASMVAAKICETVRTMHLNFHNQSLGKLTTSIGIASFPFQGETPAALLKSADLALYDAKESGRDRFCQSSFDTQAIKQASSNTAQPIHPPHD